MRSARGAYSRDGRPALGRGRYVWGEVMGRRFAGIGAALVVAATLGTNVVAGATGPSWKIQPTPNPSGATGSSLSGVSCTAATACTAVGDYGNSSGNDVTLAERYS